METFQVTIELDSFEITVNAKNKTDAKKKALTKLSHKNPVSLISREFASHKKSIYIDGI